MSAGEEQWTEPPRTVCVAPALTKGRGSVCFGYCRAGAVSQEALLTASVSAGPGACVRVCARTGPGACVCVCVRVCGAQGVCACMRVCMGDGCPSLAQGGDGSCTAAHHPGGPSAERESQPLGLARRGQVRSQALNPQVLLSRDCDFMGWLLLLFFFT